MISVAAGAGGSGASMRRVSIAAVNGGGVAAPMDGLMWFGLVVNSQA